MIRVNNLSYTIPKGATILDHVNFEVKKGEFLGILGRNGIGKTTLMDILMGFRPATGGSVSILGENPMSLKKYNAHEVVFLSQDVTLRPNVSIGKFLEFHAHFYPNYDKQEEKRLLNYFHLDPHDKIGALSTGQRKKVQIIAGLSVVSKVILIDEITAVLDPETRLMFFKQLEKIHSKGESCIVLATNIVEDLAGKVDDVLFIQDGKTSIHKDHEIPHLFNLEEVQ